MMDWTLVLMQLIVACGLLNVWIVRRNQETPFRGSDASSLKNEFAAYGLPLWSFYAVGFTKITAAFLLILGIWIPSLVFPAALVVSVLMLGAIGMHLKVRDPIKKSLPALVMLVLSIGICIGSASY